MANKQSPYPLPHRQRPTSVRYKATESGRQPNPPVRARRGQIIAAYLIAVLFFALMWVWLMRPLALKPRVQMVANSPCDNRVLLRGDHFPANTPINVFYTLLAEPYPSKFDSARLIPEASIMTDNAGDFALLVDPFSKPGMTSFAGIQFIVQLATSNTLIDAPLSLIKTNQSPPSLYTYDLANQARPDLAPAPSDSTDATITNTGHWSATLYADVDMQLPLLSLQELSDLWFPSGLSDSLNNTQLNPVNHSARFERTEYFPQPGNFKLVLTVDDAAQVYVDDKLVIDEKRPGGQRTNIGAIALRAGSHSFRVNYAQNGGAAALCFGWRENYVGWIARYFPNATLDGSPDSKRDEQTIDLAQNSLPFNMTPPPNNYSVIWDRDLTAKGEYELRLEAEGFARVYVDGMLVPALNRWESSNPAPTTQVCQLSNGPHHITVQYRNTGGPARIKFDYQLRDETKLPMTHAPVTCS